MRLEERDMEDGVDSHRRRELETISLRTDLFDDIEGTYTFPVQLLARAFRTEIGSE